MREAPRQQKEQVEGEKEIRIERETIPLKEGASKGIEVVKMGPKESKGKPALVLTGAWAIDKDLYKEFMEVVATEREILAFNNPRWLNPPQLSEEETELVKEYPSQVVRQARTLMRIWEAEGLTENPVLGHSQGAASAAVAALLLAKRAEKAGRPPPIRNLVLFAPPGMIGEDNFKRLMRGFSSQPSVSGGIAESYKDASGWTTRPNRADAERLREEAIVRARKSGEVPRAGVLPAYSAIGNVEETGDRKKALNASLRDHVLSNPIRAGMEVWGMANIQLLPLVRELRQKYGIGVQVWNAADDTVFPMEKMAGTMNAETGEITYGALRKDDVDMYYPIRGDHRLFFPDVVEGQLTALEEKQKRAAAERAQ